MKVYSSTVNVYFDKNIWSDIVAMNQSDRASFEALLTPLKLAKRIAVYYSPIGVLELVKGMSLEKYYDKCQSEVRLAWKMTDRHILDNPWDHVRRTACLWVGKPAPKLDVNFLDLCCQIATQPYEKLRPKIDRLRKTMKWEENWAQQLLKIKSRLRGDLDLCSRGGKCTREAEEFRSPKGVLARRIKYWRHFCRHFDLSLELEQAGFEEAFRELHSYRYWVDYRIAYENKIICECQNPKPSDYFDWEQLVYLNMMDYLVTNDKGIINVLKASINPELEGVAMRLSEFIASLRGRLPVKRAPDTPSTRWVDARL